MSRGGNNLMRNYELMTIHRPELGEDEISSKVTELETFLGAHGATVTSTDLWGKRRFAYEINHTNEGYYSVLTFDADTELVSDLDRVLSLADDVVRHKIVRPGA
ncbi:MAG: 30S ribosomal protein S6 [Acidimicrobiia bacterium]